MKAGRWYLNGEPIIDAAMWRRIEEMSGEYITDIAKDTSKIFRRVDWGH